MLQYLLGLGVLVLGASWAAVPLYRAFCAHTGYGGTTQQDKDGTKLAALVPSKREVTVSFTADVNPSLHWRFVPVQPSLKARLGEPVLAFYRAHNELDRAVTGVATYNVTPLKTGAYFHKIQVRGSMRTGECKHQREREREQGARSTHCDMRFAMRGDADLCHALCVPTSVPPSASASMNNACVQERK